MDRNLPNLLNFTIYPGAFVGLGSSLAQVDWVPIIAVSVAFVSAVVNVWYKRKMVRLAREELDFKRSQAR